MNKNKTKKHWALVLLIVVLSCLSSPLFAYPIAPTGEKLNDFLDSLDVTKHWLPNRDIEWSTGVSLGRYRGAYGTHCSAFVAAAASKLRVPILNPADHEGMLANAQNYWLRHQGLRRGWAPVNSHVAAQKIANQGCLVVISYANPNRGHPGHIAIVRPSSKPTSEIISRGPQVIQAGSKNYNSTTLSKVFRNPQIAFRKHRIVYFAHATPFCRLLAKKDDKKDERGHSKTKKL